MPLRFLKLLGLCAALFFACFLLQTLIGLTHFHIGRDPLDLTANKGAGQALLYLIVLFGVKLFAQYVWKPENGPSRRLYWRERRRALRGFILTASLTLAVQSVWYGLLLLMGDCGLSLHRVSGKIIGQTIQALLVVIVLAATEETIFRAFIFNYLRGSVRKTLSWGAVCGSAFLFALAHKFHEPLGWFNSGGMEMLIGLFLLGVLLAVVYSVTGSLACSIGVHVALVWLDVARKRTELLTLHQTHWWMGTNNDLRTAPLIWLLFLLLTFAFRQAGPWLAKQARIEEPET